MFWFIATVILSIICAFSVYQNIQTNKRDIYSAVVANTDRHKPIKSPLHSKETVCAALRDRILNRDGKGPLPDDSPVQKYWEDLNCLSVHLPSLHVKPESSSSGGDPKDMTHVIEIHDNNRSNEPDPNMKEDIEIPIVDNSSPKKSQDEPTLSVDVDSSTPEFRCNKLKRTHCVEVGFSWGTMYKESEQHLWKQLECDKWATEDTTENCKNGRPPAMEKSKSLKKPTSEDEKTCINLQATHLVVPGVSWGSLDPDQQVLWSKLKCNELVKDDSVVQKVVELVENPSQDMNKPPATLKKTKAKSKSKKADSFTDEDWCKENKNTYRVIPMQSWGMLPQNMQDTWRAKHCDVMFTKLRMGQHNIVSCLNNSKIDKKSAKLKDPLIAIMAGSTSRKMQQPSVNTMSLFTLLLPSLIRTLDCDFRYVFVLGYDKGDPFFDTEVGLSSVKKWFDKNVQQVLHANGISISLHTVKINNSIKKPGPIFLGMARAAYEMGADYFYRLNDDTEIAGRWPARFVSALNSLPAPFGVVGPHCKQGNTGILTHDFVHRTHLEIFSMNYYPPELVDWWMDDWISRVYGYKRTLECKSCLVVHHTGAHGQRYQVDKENFKNLERLISEGRQLIRKWMLQHNVSNDMVTAFETDNFDFTRRRHV